MDLSYTDIWNIIKKIINSNKNKYLIKHHIDSYNYFLNYQINAIIEEFNPLIIIKKNKKDETKYYEYEITFSNARYGIPLFNDKDGRKNILYPHDARNKQLTYSMPLYIDILIKSKYIENNNIIECKKINEDHILFGNIPLMIKSQFCLLNDENYVPDGNECDYDIGSYFIINGNDKILISQERLCDNKIFNFKMKDNKYSYISEIRCNDSMSKMANVFRIKFLGKENLNGKCLLYTSFNNLKTDIPLIILFKYLGVEKDHDIIKYILHDVDNLKDKENYLQLLKPSFIHYYENIENYKNLEQYIKKFLINKTISVESIIDEKVLNMCKTKKEKIFYLGYITKQLLDVLLKKRKTTDRDHFKNKRIETSGILFAQLFRKLYKNSLKSLKLSIQKEINSNLIINVEKFIKVNIIENGLKYALATGNWNSKVGYENKKIGVAQVLNRLTYSATVSHLRRLNAPVGKKGKMLLPRKLHNSQFGYICAAESPEGHAIGLVKNLSLSTIISTNIDKNPLLNYIKKFNCIKINDIDNVDEMKNQHTKIFIDGCFLFYSDDGVNVYNKLIELKKLNYIHYTISIIFDYNFNKIKINTEEGRVLRPFFVVKNNKINLTQDFYDRIISNDYIFEDLVKQNIIEYIDLDEIDNKMICDNMKKLNNNKYINYTHSEIHPSLILGVCASLIPFPDHNQSPRNTYQSAMGKQSIGYSLTNFNKRMDTYNYILHYPQRPIVYTKSSELLGFNELPAGQNLIIAIACHTGYNQEDSVIVNQGSIDRGLFNITMYRTYKSEEKKDMTSLAQEKFCIPERDKCIGIRKGSYKNLDNNGLIHKETVVKGNDIIIGKITPIINKQISNTKKKMKYKDTSVQLRHNEDGIVDNVLLDYNVDGYRIAKVKVRSTRSLEIADKMSSRHGQKGTIGLILPEEDMPFTEDGICPDVIINPHAIPSRMTIAQLIECIMGKIGSMKGKFFDGTPFEKVNIDNLCDELDDLGFEHKGYETLYNGETGEKIKSKIFIGPTFYQRLKHMVKDKIHARARGPIQILTRQPAEGRSRDGGLRLGEMETDCILSHGASYFLKEKTFECSDKFQVHICNKCGIIANVNNDIYNCLKCDNKNDFSKINLPYATKLLFMEIASMNVNTKFTT